MRSKKRQTMAKMTRERTVKERRARKQEKKDEKKQAAALGHEAEPGAEMPEAPAGDDETLLAEEAGIRQQP